MNNSTVNLMAVEAFLRVYAFRLRQVTQNALIVKWMTATGASNDERPPQVVVDAARNVAAQFDDIACDNAKMLDDRACVLPSLALARPKRNKV